MVLLFVARSFQLTPHATFPARHTDTLRFLNIQTNKYARYYRGHSAQVTTLVTCATNDVVLSGALDGAVKMWDLRSPLAQVRDTPPVSLCSAGGFDGGGVASASFC